MSFSQAPKLPPKLPYDAVFFDLDGTLIDSEVVAVNAVMECLLGHGVGVTLEDAEVLTGRKWDFAFDYLFSKYPLPAPRPQVEQEILDLYHAELKTDFRAIPGAVEWVQLLSQHTRLAVVSGSSRAEIAWALEKLGLSASFERIFGAEDYGASKPSPECYLKALAELQVKKDRALIFEDSTAGITAARSAGVSVVAITAANHTGQDQSGAVTRIRDFRGLSIKSLKEFAEAVSKCLSEDS